MPHLLCSSPLLADLDDCSSALNLSMENGGECHSTVPTCRSNCLRSPNVLLQPARVPCQYEGSGQKKEGLLNQCEICLLLLRPPIVLVITGHLPFRKGLPDSKKAFHGEFKAFHDMVEALLFWNDRVWISATHFARRRGT